MTTFKTAQELASAVPGFELIFEEVREGEIHAFWSAYGFALLQLTIEELKMVMNSLDHYRYHPGRVLFDTISGARIIISRMPDCVALVVDGGTNPISTKRLDSHESFMLTDAIRTHLELYETDTRQRFSSVA